VLTTCGEVRLKEAKLLPEAATREVILLETVGIVCNEVLELEGLDTAQGEETLGEDPTAPYPVGW